MGDFSACPMRCPGAKFTPQIMNADGKDFLKRLVETPSPSGYEHNVQKLVRERIRPWCDSVRT
ncbi:MAG TPA: hypothetical protein VK818_05300, partial [Methylomirabilota bacterium]|nr:hypothetical protein [Methylomirabilota bacterium]